MTEIINKNLKFLIKMLIFIAINQCSTEESTEIIQNSQSKAVSFIQNKINTAQENEIILIKPGVYYEKIRYPIGKSIHLLCETSIKTCFDQEYQKENHIKDCSKRRVDADIDTENLCILDGSLNIQSNFSSKEEKDMKSAIVTFVGGGNNAGSIESFVIRNGKGEKGGGISILNNSNPLLKNLIIMNNSGHEGGGIYIESSESQLEDIIIIENNAESGGGINLINSHLSLKNILISNNFADFGGTIFMDIHSSILDDNLHTLENQSTYGVIKTWNINSYNFTQ